MIELESIFITISTSGGIFGSTLRGDLNIYSKIQKAIVKSDADMNINDSIYHQNYFQTSNFPFRMCTSKSDDKIFLHE